MNIVFKSKRERLAICVGLALLVWGAASVLLFMLLSLRNGGLVLLHFNLYHELWIEFPLALGITVFGLWLMWFAAKKSRIGRYKMWTNATGSGYWNDAGNWAPPGIPLMFHRPSNEPHLHLVGMPCTICGEVAEHDHYPIETERDTDG